MMKKADVVNQKPMWETPFSIGGVQFPNRLIQGPLAGISCGAFRALFSLYEKPAYCVTEMISAKDLIQKKHLDSRFVRRDKAEGKLCYQLSGNNPLELARATEIVASLGADLIDLNIGCPKPKIRTKGAGSKLLEYPDVLFKLLSAMRHATTLPLTAKIRTQGNTNDNAYLEAALAIQEAGVDALIVHTRHWTEDYETACSYEQCRGLVETLSIPVVANGDIKDKTTLKKCMRETGAEAFMIGRGAIGKPWWFQSILGTPPSDDYHTQLKLYLTHLKNLVSYLDSEKLALLSGRRLLKHYLGKRFDSETRERIFSKTSIEDLSNFLNQLNA